jgi:hypothetical protein
VPERDRLTSLLVDLQSLRGRDRRAILAALSAAERARIAAHSRPPSRVKPASQAEPTRAFSDWLHARLNDADGNGAVQITTAARDALRSAAGAVAVADFEQAAPRGRSLLGALGSLLAGGLEAR